MFSESLASQFEGCWISECGNKEIQCKEEDGRLMCRWENGVVESFLIDSTTLTGAQNHEICGWYSDDRSIKWNTGNQWAIKGNYL